MSERINARDSRASIRWKLLTGVSAIALTAYVSSIDLAKAENADRPTLWVDLGGQFDSETDSTQTWLPPNVPAPLVQPTFEPFGRMPRIGYDLEGRISFQPTSSDWIFSASIQYGKAKHGPKSTHDQDKATGYNSFYLPAPPTYAFTDSHSVAEAKHLILDFHAGKDLGLGLFGGRGSSTVNFGVRMAHFTERASGAMTAQISVTHKYQAGVDRNADLRAARSFAGIGPSVGWNGSLPLTGSLADGIALDWGANAAVLFGRQKTDISLHTNAVRYISFGSSVPATVLSHSTSEPSRKKQVIVPNVGGFAGLSYRMGGIVNVSFGYRADFFFGAIDGGIATHKSENRGFFGPFASLSVGIGD